MRHAIAFLLGFAFLSSSQAAEEWPQFRGPTGDGHANATSLPTTWSEKENVRWKVAIHDKGWSSPVIWGDQIWLTTSKANYAADAPSENAQKKIPKPESLELYAVCVSRSSGKVIHDILLRTQEKPDYCHSFNSYATPTPVVEAGRVYVHFGSHGTFCIDSQTGKPIWERLDFPCDHWRGPGSSPIVYGDHLFLTFDGHDQQYVAALNKSDGKTAWKKDRKIKYSSNDGDIKKAYSTPSILEVNGKPQLISPAAEATIAYDPKSGDELWRVIHGGMNEACKPVFSDKLIFLTSGHSASVLAINKGAGGVISKKEFVWRTIKGAPSRPSLVLDGGNLYMVSDNGVVSCLDASTGTQKWQEQLSSAFSASPILAGGNLYFCDQDGKTHVLAAGDEFKPVKANKLDAGFMASPAVADNELFLRTKTHLYCISTGK